MAYVKDRLVARRGYSGFGDATTTPAVSADQSWWENLLGGTATGFSAGQTSSASATQAAINAQAAANSPFSTGNLALLGVLGVGAYLLIKKKNS